ncbi:hypothetical protein POK33_38040 [Burkholderia cenocepacia]|uniref:hypothetical protein n=1 Tax=Burkholderia cenocepacia TaxID=95486 RepID=UPI0023B957F3|nr:hypothetical protein [Burkholderia cenocepacia]MDF0506556.1 hypothetical protein [Burkholderia cenocepacia]
MASVTIELGSGKRATLTRVSDSAGASRSASQRSDVSELMLHWPKYEGLTTNAREHLRQLGLGTLQGAPLDALRSAIEDGRVAVEIDRKVGGGGAAGGQPSTPPFPRANRLASVPGVASLPADKPLPSWATPSDVSAGELISYLESVVGGAGSSLASSASGLVDGTPLGDAAPFSLDDLPLGNDPLDMAARVVNEGLEAECMDKYEAAIELCNRLAKVMGGPAGLALCKQNAFMDYQECRGF